MCDTQILTDWTNVSTAMEAVKDAGAPATDSAEADAGPKKPTEKKPAAKK